MRRDIRSKCRNLIDYSGEDWSELIADRRKGGTMRRVVEATTSIHSYRPNVGVFEVAGIEPADAGFERAEAYYRAGNFTMCRDLIEQHLAEHPGDAACLMLNGNVLLELDESKSAIEAFRAATQIAPDEHEAWSQMGIALMTEGRLEDAAEAFRTAVRLNPDNFRARVDLGNVLYMLGRSDKALESLEEASRLRPGDLGILRNLAGMYVSAKRNDSALIKVQEILKFNPSDLAARCDAAWLLFEMRRLNEAAEMFGAIRRDDFERDHELYAIHGLVMIEVRRKNWRQALMLAIEATKLDRYDFTTALLSYISSKLFDQASDVSEDELFQRFEDEYREVRTLHLGQSVA
jgi:Flp pilus assembly protein TadD